MRCELTTQFTNYSVVLKAINNNDTGPSFPPIYFYSTIFLEIVSTFSDCIIRSFVLVIKVCPMLVKVVLLTVSREKRPVG